MSGKKTLLMRALLLVQALLCSSIVFAQTLTIAGGKTIRASTTEHEVYRAEINFAWKPEIWSHEGWALSLNQAVSAITFRDKNNVSAFSLAPNLVLCPRERNGLHPYVQLGFGIAYLSDDKFESQPKEHPLYQLDGTTDMGSHWQFESSFAVGLEIDRMSIRAKIYHYSNAELANENEGIDVAEFGLSYSF